MKIYKYKDKLAIIQFPSTTFYTQEMINLVQNGVVEHKTLCTIMFEDGSLAAVEEKDLEFFKEVEDDDTNINECEDNINASME